MRDTGIAIVGSATWGMHFRQFYQDKQDLKRWRRIGAGDAQRREAAGGRLSLTRPPGQSEAARR